MQAASELGDPLAANQAQWAAAKQRGLPQRRRCLTNKKKMLKDQEKSYFDLFGSITDGFQKVIDGLVAGTLDMKGVFESLKTSIVGSFTAAFAEGLKSKLGFDKSFKLNIVGLGKEVYGMIGGLFGGGPEGSGFFSGLLSGVDKYTGGIFSGIGSKLGGFGVAGTAAGGPVGGTPIGGASGYLGLGGTAGLLLGAGTYAGLSGQNNYAGMLSGAAGLGYGAQALFASPYGAGATNYLAQHAPQLLKLGGLFGARATPIPGAVGFSPDVPGAHPVRYRGTGLQAGGTFGTIAGVIGVVTSLASAALGVYGAIKADTAHAARLPHPRARRQGRGRGRGRRDLGDDGGNGDHSGDALWLRHGSVRGAGGRLGCRGGARHCCRCPVRHAAGTQLQ